MGKVHAASDQKHRLLRLFHQGDRLFELTHMHTFVRLISADIDLCRIGGRTEFRHHIRRQIHENRARLAGTGNVKCLLDPLRQHLPVSYHNNKLRYISCDTDNIHFLKCIIADQIFRHLTGEAHQRNTVVVRRGNSCYQIRRSRTTGDEADADLSCGSRITVCRMNQALLMSRKHQINTMTIMECVQEIDDHTARICKNSIHAFFFHCRYKKVIS